MAYYIYIKNPPNELTFRNKRSKKTGLFLTIIGVILLSLFLWPIISWKLFYIDEFNPKLKGAGAAEKTVSVKSDNDGFSYFTISSGKSVNISQRPYHQFYLSIPKLGIKNSIVKIDSLDFKQSLAHFPGSALPGQTGNVFITGHSVLPQFFNPGDYNSMFSTLPNLKIGDFIYLSVSGINYQYQVVDLIVVEPDDISVLYPPDNTGKYLKLMTCVPPGLASQRLIVLSRLVEESFEENS